MRARKLLPALLVTAAAAVALAGCTFHAEAGPTDSPQSVAKHAEDALEKQVGQRPDIDCGTKPIVLVNKKTITCELTDPSSGDVYDAKVTFSDVHGADYHIDVKVADTPTSKGDGGSGDSSDAPSDPSAGGLTEPGTKIASLAANALASQLGFTPDDMVCAEDAVPITAGYVESCSFSHDDVQHDVNVTITDVDGTNYQINAKVVS